MKFIRSSILLTILLLIHLHAPLHAANTWIMYVTNATSSASGATPSTSVLPIALTTPPSQDSLSTVITGSNPFAIAINPASTVAYAVNNVDQTLSAIDIAKNKVSATATLGSNPFSIAITPDGMKVFIPNFNDNNVTSIDLIKKTFGPKRTIPTGLGPNCVAIGPNNSSPSTGKAYVGNFSDNSVTVIDTTHNTVITTINGVGSRPFAIATHPDGTKMYVCCTGNDNVAIIDTATNTVEVTKVPVGGSPNGITINSKGTRAYVSNFSTNDVTVIDLTTSPPTVVTTISGMNQPLSIAISPDGQSIYVGNPGNSTISIINAATNTITGTITSSNTNLNPQPSGVPFLPSGIAITPDQAPVAAFTVINPQTATIAGTIISQQTYLSLLQEDDLIPLDLIEAPHQSQVVQLDALDPLFTVQFDASNSFSPVGAIVSYAWDFGDGTTTVTSDPIVTHTYNALAGSSFQVTLVVTNSAGTSTTQIFTGRTMNNNGGPNAIASGMVMIPQSPPGPPLPPSHFLGVIKKNKFLNKTEYVLKATWNPSPSPKVVFYRIYMHGKAVAKISASSPLVFKKHLHSLEAAEKYKVAAVSSDHLESQHIKLRIVHK